MILSISHETFHKNICKYCQNLMYIIQLTLDTKRGLISLNVFKPLNAIYKVVK